MPRRRTLPSLLVAASLIAGCDQGASGPLQARENAFVWSGHVPAGATVAVRDFSGGIVVEPSADDTVRVTARLEWRRGNPDESLRMSGTREGQDVLICAIWGRGKCSREQYTANFRGRSPTEMKVFFTVSVPAGVKLDLTNIAGDVVAVASAPVRATTMNGDVRVATAMGPVRGETLNGSVDIRMSSLAGSDSVIAKTLNGSAFIYLPSVDDAVIELGVGNGTVSTAFPENAPSPPGNRKVRVTLGAGTRVIHGYALNGEVALRKLDAEGRSY